MTKTAIIARHEFVNTIRRKSYILFTLAFPLLALLVMLVSQVISGLNRPEVMEKELIGYVDETAGFTLHTVQGKIELQPFTTGDTALRALLDKDIKEYFIIPRDYLQTGLIQRYTLERELEPGGETLTVIRNFLLTNLLKEKNETAVIERVKSPLNMVSTVLTETGEAAPNQGGFATFIIPYIFSLLLLMSIFFSSGYLLQGLGEEKENRVMEILLSSVSSRALLAGKIMGLGAAGLLQVIVWLVSANFLARFASSTFGAVIGMLQVPADFLVLGVIYFVLGYLLFAVLMAGAGAVSPTAREAQQTSTLFSLAGVVPLFFMTFIIENPNHVVSRLLTIFPITAPLTVMMRYGLTDIPWWELAVSIVLLILAIGGSFVLCARLFRTFLLMYGKRPDFKEIVRSFRSA
ncbi:MAG: ABC transporter permease [Dehalococcoidia bacterium]|nr:ABC transporter permease [Dehalococcoidia bacterium]